MSLNNSGNVFIWNRIVPDILRTLSSTAVQFLDGDFTLKPENCHTESGCCFQTEPHFIFASPRMSSLYQNCFSVSSDRMNTCRGSRQAPRIITNTET